MSLDELFSKGFLKKVAPSADKARKSLDISAKYLSEAKAILSVGANYSAITNSYSSIFHAARAILFTDGVSERGHFAIYEYLKEKHKALGIAEISTFNLYRKLRHSVAYGPDTVVGKEDAEEAVRFALEFHSKVRKYLKL